MQVSSIRDSVLDRNVPVMVPAKYVDHTNVSFPNFTAELPERTGINDHPIEMIFQVVCRYSNIVHPPDGQ